MGRSKAEKKARENFHEGRQLHKQRKWNEAETLFRQAAIGFEECLGREHEKTLETKDWLGNALFRQGKFNEAEVLLQEAAEGREKILGKEHSDTLCSKNLLGRTLKRQAQYDRARDLFQQTAQDSEKVLGKGDRSTLNSKFWLGQTLYAQEKYSEAEGLFQQVVEGLKTTCGEENESTLLRKLWLGQALYQQEKYSQAEGFLRQAAKGYKKEFGRERDSALESEHWLGKTICCQGNYSEAEKLLQHVNEGYKAKHGEEDECTLDSSLWLGHALYQQEKYSQAEKFFWQAAKGYEKKFGREDENTLESVHWLKRALCQQDTSNKAGASPKRVPETRQEVPNKDNITTIHIVKSEQESPSGSILSGPTNDQSSSGDRLGGFFLDRDANSNPYTDLEINQISILLRNICPEWSTWPRTYIILRVIGQLGSFNDLLHVGFSDYWLPATERSLPGLLPQRSRAAFVRVQRLVLTKSFGIEKGQHCHFDQGEPLPFTPNEVLGNGALGQVDKITSTISRKEYARKRVLRSAIFKGPRKEHTIQLITEIKILKGLQHRHIVELVGSYTDPRYIGLIMLPIAEMDLSQYLRVMTDSKRGELRSFFGCLASALTYLHARKIRHKDIKPSNILVNRGNVLFADFGLSLHFEDANGSTTTGMVNGRTPRYCAPEVAQLEPRNTKSDIWSLGVVFMEMIVVLKSMTLQAMDGFFEQHGSRQVFIRANIDALPEFAAELGLLGRSADNRALVWTQKMLSLDQHARPTALLLSTWIKEDCDRKDGEGESSFCGRCCDPPEECFSDRED